MTRAPLRWALLLPLVGGCLVRHAAPAAAAHAQVRRVAAALAGPWRLALAPAFSAAPAAPTARCVATAKASFHLRPRAVAASVGRELPPGTLLEVLALSSAQRLSGSGAVRPPVLARVRVVASRREGFAFVAPDELDAGCPLLSDARASGGARAARLGAVPPAGLERVRAGRAEYLAVRREAPGACGAACASVACDGGRRALFRQRADGALVEVATVPAAVAGEAIYLRGDGDDDVVAVGRVTGRAQRLRWSAASFALVPEGDQMPALAAPRGGFCAPQT